MLETLRRIVQKVNAASNLEEALQIIVREVKAAVDANVSSVYLTDFERRTHVLMASQGLRKKAVGKVTLPMHRGLVGLVCEKAEPLNLDDATAHPRYLKIAETGETRYHAFLGVPIIQNRKVLGVLVVRRQRSGCFSDDEVTFLLTLAAQLAGAIVNAKASGELTALQQEHRSGGGYLNGRPSASGVAMGEVRVIYPPANLDLVPDRACENAATEKAQLKKAVERVKRDLNRLKKNMQGVLPNADQALFDALLLMLDGDALVSETEQRIDQGEWVQSALRHTVESHARVFDEMEDAYLRERASDVRDLGRRILGYLQNQEQPDLDYPEGTILAGEDLTAVDLVDIPGENLRGIVSATGSSASHLAILARAMGIPAVMGVGELPMSRIEGHEVIVDGYRGRIYISPEPTVREEYLRLIEEDRELDKELESLRGEPPETTDGVTLPLYLNTGLASEISELGVEESAGVGLYRTEFPFMVRDRFPAEEVQMEIYRRLLERFAPRPVLLRTLDVGGDKPLPYFPVSESNPFLGWRGIRISLDHPEIFLTQVRAMLRAAVGLNNLSIMLPMVSLISEVDELLQLLNRAHDELREEGHQVSLPKFGVMVEVPALAYQIEALARRVDFLSIGSNDLTQYLLAVDRNNPRVAEIYDDLHPAVLRMLVQIIDGAKAYSRPVSLCGEMAGNPMAAVLLLGMGVSSLSMSAGSLLRVKWAIRSFSRARARQLLQSALRMEEASQVRRLMEGALDEIGLGGLVRPGR